MQLIVRHDLPFVTARLTHAGASIEILHMLLDTGAASTVINADLAAEVRILPQPDDQLRRLRGVGGHEHVFVRRVDRLQVETRELCDFEVEIGEMDYGFKLDGILGMDFLLAAGAVIDLSKRTIAFS